MSVKHVKQYYNEICNQYHDYISELKDFEQLCNDGLVSPETIDQAKKFLEPLKDNWEKITYFMFLLNKPNKVSKQQRYNKCFENKLPDKNTASKIYNQNKESIDNMKDLNNKERQ